MIWSADSAPAIADGPIGFPEGTDALGADRASESGEVVDSAPIPGPTGLTGSDVVADAAEPLASDGCNWQREAVGIPKAATSISKLETRMLVIRRRGGARWVSWTNRSPGLQDLSLPGRERFNVRGPDLDRYGPHDDLY